MLVVLGLAVVLRPMALLLVEAGRQGSGDLHPPVLLPVALRPRLQLVMAALADLTMMNVRSTSPI